MDKNSKTMDEPRDSFAKIDELKATTNLNR